MVLSEVLIALAILVAGVLILRRGQWCDQLHRPERGNGRPHAGPAPVSPPKGRIACDATSNLGGSCDSVGD